MVERLVCSPRLVSLNVTIATCLVFFAPEVSEFEDVSSSSAERRPLLDIGLPQRVPADSRDLYQVPTLWGAYPRRAFRYVVATREPFRPNGHRFYVQCAIADVCSAIRTSFLGGSNVGMELDMDNKSTSLKVTVLRDIVTYLTGRGWHCTLGAVAPYAPSPGGRAARGASAASHHREGHELVADLVLRQEKPLAPDCRLDIEPLGTS